MEVEHARRDNKEHSGDNRHCWGILVLGVVCITFAGGDSLIQGMGNSSNRIYANRIADEVAEAIAASSVVPEVSDDELRAT